MRQAFLISVFGIFGILARWGLDLTLKPMVPATLPYATLAINVIGSFLAGGVLVFMQNSEISPSILSAVLIGGLGGFTTFSAFAIQSLELFQGGFPGAALAYGFLSWAGTIIAAWGGFALTRSFIA